MKEKTSTIKLVRLLMILSTLAGITIIILSTYASHSLFSKHVLNIAEHEAETISKEFLRQFKYTVFIRDENLEIIVNPNPAEYLNLDQEIRVFLKDFNVIKLKIYNADKTIVYSTDQKIIGKLDTQNIRLQRALEGQLDSHEENKDSFRDLTGETEFNIDVVETYVPIFYNNKVVGSFEIYRNISKFNKAIHDGTRNYALLLLVILLPVYLLAFMVARIGTRKAKDDELELRQKVTHDALTGVYNRGGIMERANEEVSRIARIIESGGAAHLSFIMFDIDHFKKVNDTLGHPAGDSVLRQLSGRVGSSLRLYDVLGRYGGEEFIIVLPNATLDNAGIIAERIRKTVEEKPFEHQALEIPVTISLGVASYAKGLELNDIIEKADKALYTAKEGGRNRVVKA